MRSTKSAFKMGSKFLSIMIEVTVMTIIVSVLLTLVLASVLVLIHICIVGMTRTAMQGSNGTSLEDPELLPSFEFQPGDINSIQPGDINSIECAVCLGSFDTGEKCRMLPVCKHSFHAHCLDSWSARIPA